MIQTLEPLDPGTLGPSIGVDKKMSYLVIARKWRPQSFDELIGQEHVSRTLSNAIKSNRVHHAFLFTGVRGIGKTTAARVLAKALNCETGPTPTPCNQCNNCKEITSGNCIDVLEIDGASNTGVDDVREIIDNVRYQPAKCRFKIYIIDEVHMLSTSAFNALLKTLEEPPAHVKFIFATTDPHKVPHTIHSRCQRYDFKRIPYRLIVEHLAHIATSEGIDVSERALFAIAREGEGSMRDAQSLFDQVLAYAGKQIKDEDVSAALGLADRNLIYAVGAAIVGRDPTRAVELLNDLHLYGYDMRRFARELLEHFRNLAVARLVPDGSLFEDLPREEVKQLQEQAGKLSGEDSDRAFRLLLAAETDVTRATSPKLVLEMLLIKLATLTPVRSIESLLSKLDALERRLAGAPPVAAAAEAGPRSHGRVVQANRSAGVQAAAAAKTSASPPARDLGGPLDDNRWEEFVGFVAKEKVALATFLRGCTAARISDGALQFVATSSAFYDYLVKPEHAQLVEQQAQQFFGSSLRVKVTQGEAAVSEEPAEPSAAELHEAALAHPKVQAAMSILGGEVQEVRPRPRRGQVKE